MTLSRRKFISGVGATITYAICAGNGVSDAQAQTRTLKRHAALIDRNYPGVIHKDWIEISADGKVTASTARNEIGQGLETVIVNVISQGLELDPELIEVRMGDTSRCPNDGPTTGSNATERIVWAFWLACFEIRRDLVHLASVHLDHPAKWLVYTNGLIHATDEPDKRVAMGALANNQVRSILPDYVSRLPVDIARYTDPKTVNINARAYVTGEMTYTSDLTGRGCLYGGFLLPPFHHSLTRPLNVDFSAALAIAGVTKAGKLKGNRIAVLADSYTAVQKGLAALKVDWQQPDIPISNPTGPMLRQGSKLVKVVEQRGKVKTTADSALTFLTESYHTQYGTQVPIETDTAIAERNGEGFLIRMGTQNPFHTCKIVARYFGISPESVHVISMPTGDGFGAKAGHRVGLEAAILADWAGQPVKLVHSRKYNIRGRSKYKAAVLFDIASAVDDKGKLVSRNIDIHQDVGFGTTKVYNIPNVLTSLYKTELPFTRAIMRGTSYTQSVWAIESHIDMLATAVGLDPIEFRRRNVKDRFFLPLLDSCIEMMNYTSPKPANDRGVGFGIICHGGRQYGVVGAEVSVDSTTGKVRVLKMAGAFDIGLVINSTLARTGVESAMLWGMSWALLEEVSLDNHRCRTSGFSNYKIARFKDTPEMDVRFLGDTTQGPRGCGEMPLPAAIAAVTNAVFHATGVRFYQLPVKAEKIKAAKT